MTGSHFSFATCSVPSSDLSKLATVLTLWAFLSLFSGGKAWGQPTSCSTAVENATIIVPDTVSVQGGGSAFFHPDSIAVLSPEGKCVGAAQWPTSVGTTIAVAGNTPLQTAGMKDEDSFRFRLYNAYGEQHRDGSGAFVKCERLSNRIQIFCRDDGRYEDDAVYILRKVRLSPPSTEDGLGVQRVQLSPPYPNPTREQVKVRFATPDRQKISLRLYDTLGRVVRTLGQGMVAGQQVIGADLSRLASGTYFLRLRTEGETLTRRVTVVQ